MKEKLGVIYGSFRIIKEGFAVIRQDKELLLVPILGCIVQIIIAAIFFSIYFFLLLKGSFDIDLQTHFEQNKLFYGLIIVSFYTISTISINFFQSIIFTISHARFSGGDFSLTDGIKASIAKLIPLILWSIIMATVGILISFLERQKNIGRFVGYILGKTWKVLTYFSLPAIVIANKSIRESFADSASSMQKTWGETAVIYFGTGYAFTIIGILIVSLPFGLLLLFPLQMSNTLLLFLFAVSFILFFILFLLSSTLESIYKMALYEYASTGKIPSAFSEEMILSGIRAKEEA